MKYIIPLVCFFCYLVSGVAESKMAADANNFEMAYGSDPDVTAIGQLSIDTNGTGIGNTVLRVYDSSKGQVSIGNSYLYISGLVPYPNNYPDDVRDRFFLFNNDTGMSCIINRMFFRSDQDNLTLDIVEGEGWSKNLDSSFIQAVTISDDAVGTPASYYSAYTSVDHEVETANDIYADFDDVATNDYVFYSIEAYCSAEDAVIIETDFTGNHLRDWYDPEAGSACTGTSCDNFTLDTTDDELDDDGRGLIIFYEAHDSVDQIACFKQNVIAGDAYHNGAVLRQSGDVVGTANGYAIRNEAAGDDLMPRSCDGVECTDMAAAVYSLADPFDADDWLCYGVQGTGTDTIMYFWDMGTTEPDPGTNPTFSTQPTVAWCDDGTCSGDAQLASDGDVNLDLDGTPGLVDTGDYTGIYSSSTPISDAEFGEFKAWSE
jgi:hypothetical protein